MRRRAIAIGLSVWTLVGCTPPTPQQRTAMNRLETTGLTPAEKRRFVDAFVFTFGAKKLARLWVYPAEHAALDDRAQTIFFRYELKEHSIFEGSSGCVEFRLLNGVHQSNKRSYACRFMSGEEDLTPYLLEAQTSTTTVVTTIRRPEQTYSQPLPASPRSDLGEAPAPLPPGAPAPGKYRYEYW